MKANKACPVVVRDNNGDLQILAFRHPLAGFQLVKGSIEENELAAHAALRELFEEAGIKSASVVKDLGIWDSGFDQQIWSFHVCATDGLPDKWIYHTKDDGGHDFAFFWQSLNAMPDDDWHPLFRAALIWVKSNYDNEHNKLIY